MLKVIIMVMAAAVAAAAVVEVAEGGLIRPLRLDLQRRKSNTWACTTLRGSTLSRAVAATGVMARVEVEEVEEEVHRVEIGEKVEGEEMVVLVEEEEEEGEGEGEEEMATWRLIWARFVHQTARNINGPSPLLLGCRPINTKVEELLVVAVGTITQIGLSSNSDSGMSITWWWSCRTT